MSAATATALRAPAARPSRSPRDARRGRARLAVSPRASAGDRVARSDNSAIARRVAALVAGSAPLAAPPAFAEDAIDAASAVAASVPPSVSSALSSLAPAGVEPGVAAVAGAGVVVAACASLAARASGPRLSAPGSSPFPGSPSPLPNATPNLRGTGASASGRGRGYLIAPPPLFPLVPAFSRRTYRYEVDPGRMWFFEQKQGIGLGLNVSVNVRMTVIKLKTGGLWVHAPIAPTDECVALLEELGAPVEHVVLPTTLFEHKIFVGPFQRKFPDARCWIAPDQWSWPVNLPATFFGIFKSGVLGQDEAPWEDEFELELLQPPALGVASYVSFTECAFFHKPSKTLLVTDAVVYASDSVPDAIPDRDLLESGDDGNFTIAALKFLNLFDIATKAKARTRTSEDMSETERLRLGWLRNALQALYFGPSNLLDPEESWRRVSNRLIVAPVVSTLVYENVPGDVREWAKRVGRWRFERVVPCHFDAPIKAGPREWNAAFAFLDAPRRREVAETDGGAKGGKGAYYPDEDMVLLRGVERFLREAGVIFTDENRPKFGRINARARGETR